MPNVDSYRFAGFYDLSLFNAEFLARFANKPRFNIGALPALSTLVDLINKDPDITDVRWAAYMLATVMWETTSPVEVETAAKDKRGRPILKDGKPVLLKHRKWLMTMAPVEEVGHGKGRRYHEPVKVAAVDGGARVTEQDGDQFSVSATGGVKPLKTGAKMGSTDGGIVSKVYDDDDGDENAYYGRGYVQLTWWSNYAKSSVALGMDLDLLFHPERVLEPAVAYAIMSHGMRTGFGFANGHKFVQFFSGKKREYRLARKMVNGMDHAVEIAALAIEFEAVLLASRMWVLAAPPIIDGLPGAPGRWA